MTTVDTNGTPGAVTTERPVTAPAELFSLTGTRVLLTGATAGLGYRFAQVLHAAGAQLAVVGRRSDALQELQRTLPGCHGLLADLETADPAAVHREAVERLGAIDVLVNNAAFITPGVAAENETEADIARMMRVNLLAPVGLAQAVFPSMKQRATGSIINVTSIVAHVGIGRFPQAGYSATKGALQAITREWASQWSRYGIRVNSLAPGFIETEITREVIHRDNVQAWIGRNALLGRHGLPSDFDGALVFLASDASRYVTGQALIVDGGWTAH